MKLSRVNTFLLIVIIVVNGYTLAAPLLPRLIFAQQKQDNPPATLMQKIQNPSPAVLSGTNHLIIPSLSLDQEIFEGKSADTLQKGVWHRPFSASPEIAGNIVLSGHRFTYDNPQGTLYHLDKLRVGDLIGLIWNGEAYRYTVREVKVVTREQTSIELPTTQPRLTIYTCTPLWFPKDRLVVIAEPDTTL